MTNRGSRITLAIIFVFASETLSSESTPRSGQWSAKYQSASRSMSTGTMCAKPHEPFGSVPSYHQDPPAGALPATLDPAQFADNQTAFAVYSIAAKIRPVLYQQPCYCPCDKLADHKSLLDCFVGIHGVACPTCQAELLFAYQQSKDGKSPAEIREGIMTGKAWKVNREKCISKYSSDFHDRTAPKQSKESEKP
jgi:Protein of unknown function with PCYCGC motif